MNKTIFKQKISQKKYTQLLIILIANFILSPFLQDNVGQIVLSLIFLYAIIIIVKTFSLKARFFQFYSSVACLAFLLSLIARLERYQSWATTFLILIQSIYALYLIVAVYLILQDISRSQKVTIDTIRGSICVYLLIGFVWALLYGIIAIFNPNAFSQSIIIEEGFSKAVYFSFTTLTTLGYGDILPISPLAKMITNIEAIIGQLYPSILIAILVSDYISQRTNWRK